MYYKNNENFNTNISRTELKQNCIQISNIFLNTLEKQTPLKIIMEKSCALYDKGV